MANGWKTLGKRITTARSQRWRTRAEFAAATGLSTRLLGDLETGRRQRYLPITIATVEAALGWKHGSCESIVHGGKETPEDDPAAARLRLVWWSLSPETKMLLAEFAERAPREFRHKGTT